MNRSSYVFVCLIAILILGTASISFASDKYLVAEKFSFDKDRDTDSILHSYDKRLFAVLNAGNLAASLYNLQVGRGYFDDSPLTDPETGATLSYINYPGTADFMYGFGGGLWIGGIRGGDTITSTTVDLNEWKPDYSAINPILGALSRTGNFADDEFTMVCHDQGGWEDQKELYVEVTQNSYAWSDSLYDDFIILTYTVKNYSYTYNLENVYIGYLMDNDLLHVANISSGSDDDISAVLDTVLYDDDASSRAFIPYSFDNDGDPFYTVWDNHSVRGAISIRLLDCSFAVEHQNFNWWYYHGQVERDFGPRRVGIPSDPFRPFDMDNLGLPTTDADQYYVMSHPEVDYNGLEINAHDSTDGWIPISSDNAGLVYDTRFLYSFGPVDIPKRATVTFALAIVLSDNFHANATDFADLYDPANPAPYEQSFDFSEMMTLHRRADSVYQSGLLLPHPGPPQGMTVNDFGDTWASLSWSKSQRGDLAGYYLYVKDTLVDNEWHRVFDNPTSDTSYIFDVPQRGRAYQLAVSLVDTKGRESGPSLPMTVFTGVPDAPNGLQVDIADNVPYLEWDNHPDPNVTRYLIYRAQWNGNFELYDSTGLTPYYYDFNAESGVRYSYKISAKNDIDLESPASDPAMILYMAMDQGILFYNLNRSEGPNAGPFLMDCFEDLYLSAFTRVEMDRFDQGDNDLTFKRMADYSLIIVDWEKLENGISTQLVDSLTLYLSNGGKALFVLLSANIGSVNGGAPDTNRFVSGPYRAFFHDLLKLDSSVTNNYMFTDGSFHGDLMSCESMVDGYPQLIADTRKLENSPFIPITGYIPMSGCLYPTDDVEILYRYTSGEAGSTCDGEVNGIRYLGEDYSFILLNFPLTQMIEPASFATLARAMSDLGINMDCGDLVDNDRIDLGDIVYLINYLFRDGPAPAIMSNADINCNEEVNLGDVVGMINYLFRDKTLLRCCK